MPIPLEVKIQADLSQFRTSMQEMQSQVQGPVGTLKGETGFGGLTSAVGAFRGALAAIGVTVGMAQLVSFMSSSITAASSLQSALMSLGGTARNVGLPVDDLKAATLSLSRDGLLTVTESTLALRNLLQSGFSLPQAINLINGFKDSASFARQASFDFGTAVTRTTEGIRLGMSNVADAAGITKNLGQILKENGINADRLSEVTSDLSVRMALYNGLIKETALFQGDAAKFAKTWAGETTLLKAEITKLKEGIGALLISALQPYLPAVTAATQATAGFFKELALATPEIRALQSVITELENRKTRLRGEILKSSGIIQSESDAMKGNSAAAIALRETVRELEQAKARLAKATGTETKEVDLALMAHRRHAAELDKTTAAYKAFGLETPKALQTLATSAVANFRLIQHDGTASQASLATAADKAVKDIIAAYGHIPPELDDINQLTHASAKAREQAEQDFVEASAKIQDQHFEETTSRIEKLATAILAREKATTDAVLEFQARRHLDEYAADVKARDQRIALGEQLGGVMREIESETATRRGDTLATLHQEAEQKERGRLLVVEDSLRKGVLTEEEADARRAIIHGAAIDQIKAGENDALQAYLSNQLKQKEEAQKTAFLLAKVHGDYVGGFILGLTDAQSSSDAFFDAMFQAGRQTASALSQALDDGLFAVMKGNFTDLGDAFQTLLDSMLRTITGFLADQATRGVLNFLSALVSNSGTPGVPGSAPGAVGTAVSGTGLLTQLASGGGAVGQVLQALGFGPTVIPAATTAIPAATIGSGIAGLEAGGGALGIAGPAAGLSGAGLLALAAAPFALGGLLNALGVFGRNEEKPITPEEFAGGALTMLALSERQGPFTAADVTSHFTGPPGLFQATAQVISRTMTPESIASEVARIRELRQTLLNESLTPQLLSPETGELRKKILLSAGEGLSLRDIIGSLFSEENAAELFAAIAFETPIGKAITSGLQSNLTTGIADFLAGGTTEDILQTLQHGLKTSILQAMTAAVIDTAFFQQGLKPAILELTLVLDNAFADLKAGAFEGAVDVSAVQDTITRTLRTLTPTIRTLTTALAPLRDAVKNAFASFEPSIQDAMDQLALAGPIAKALRSGLEKGLREGITGFFGTPSAEALLANLKIAMRTGIINAITEAVLDTAFFTQALQPIIDRLTLVLNERIKTVGQLGEQGALPPIIATADFQEVQFLFAQLLSTLGPTAQIIASVLTPLSEILNRSFLLPPVRAQRGLLATGPTRALIGEREPELVAPVRAILNAMRQGGGMTVHLTVNAPHVTDLPGLKRYIRDEIVPEIKNLERRRGERTA